ncbi:bifunctional glutamate N-acetyltransferase/amino-acid acetyltransferase ArgJ [Biformimicrobium ophioploci]|uniref:Arginine biosynthesis bifunctional protein ArgJ n=1 Tax=Biformimicrobium ophioploci TaxID=3036711 RepID=A0ABQ6LX86_9GAMM|nr:bifunctional glutamate N-acetyltransferase/amino-acid acetyltransferase ArgJ [Microbulbifer sp. NKW57]GMG86656.1 bifunctional glutamate N-acetyltransferase/amino-acid acetyltransferase ArgJ [Microbulbifer sp. NKW57]
MTDQKIQPAAVEGVELAAYPARIKQWDRDDLVLVNICEGATVAATFTQNRFCAAPVTIAKEHLAAGPARALIINAGNANACTGERGLADAKASCAKVAEVLDVQAEQVLPFSTGVIGEYLPMEKILEAIPQASAKFSGDWEPAARAIMTTDTVHKLASRQVEIDGVTVTVSGMSKGSGMIHPDMATMLAYIATDAPVAQELLQALVRRAVNASFNRISVDGDTSTNDACVLIATGKAGLPEFTDAGDQGYADLEAAVIDVHRELAQAIVKDGEGASKFVTLDIRGGTSSDESLAVGRALAVSPLVKTALYASDPNWGRLVAAIGNAGIADLDPVRVSVYLDDVQIVEHGGRAASYTEEAGQAVVDKAAFTIRVELGRGNADEVLWTCDLSHDYVTINAEYRT